MADRIAEILGRLQTSEPQGDDPVSKIMGKLAKGSGLALETDPGVERMNRLTSGDEYSVGAVPETRMTGRGLPLAFQQPRTSGAPLVAEEQTPIAGQGAGGAFIAGAAKGATANFIDELAGLAAAGGSAGKGYRDKIGIYKAERDKEREHQNLAAEAHPWAHFAGEMAGAAPTAALGLGGARAATLAGRAIQGAKAGAKFGTVAGAGGSESENLAGIGVDSGIGALGGAVGGAAGTAALEGTAIAGRKVVDAVKGVLKKKGQEYLDEKLLSNVVGRAGSAERAKLFPGADVTERRADVLDAIRSVPGAERNALGGKYPELAMDVAKAAESASRDLESFGADKFVQNRELIAKIENEVLPKYSAPTQERQRKAVEKIIGTLREKYGVDAADVASRTDKELLDRIVGGSKKAGQELLGLNRKEFQTAAESLGVKERDVLTRAKQIPGLAEDLLSGNKPAAVEKVSAATQKAGEAIGAATKELDSWPLGGPSGKEFAKALRTVASESPAPEADAGAKSIRRMADAIEEKYGEKRMTFEAARQLKTYLQSEWLPEGVADSAAKKIQAKAASAAKNVFLNRVDQALSPELIKTMRGSAATKKALQEASKNMRDLHARYGELKALENALTRDVAPMEAAEIPSAAAAGKVPLTDVIGMTESTNPEVASAARSLAESSHPGLSGKIENAETLGLLRDSATAQAREAAVKSGAPLFERYNSIPKVVSAVAEPTIGRASVVLAKMAANIRAGAPAAVEVESAISSGVPREVAIRAALFARSFSPFAARAEDRNTTQIPRQNIGAQQ